MAYSEKIKLLFIHVPKSAGTSIIEAMREVDQKVKHGHFKWDNYPENVRKAKDVFSFGIVRNPWDRVFSCYNYARMDESFWHGKNSTHGVHPDYYYAKRLDFNAFIELIYNNRFILDYPAYMRPNFKDNWDYQLPYLFNQNKEQMVKEIYKYEDLDRVIDFLNTQYGLSVSKLNVSDKQGVESYKDVYTSRSAELVYEIYKEDIDHFGYSF